MKLRMPRAAASGCLFFFICAGIVYGQFASRMPALKAQTQADEAQIGMALLAFGIGSVAGFIGVGPLLRLMQSRVMLRGASACLLLALKEPSQPSGISSTERVTSCEAPL